MKWFIGLLYLFVFGVIAGACSNGSTGSSELESKARELAERYIIVDTHIDVPYRMTVRTEDISERTTYGDFDFPRAKEGGLNAPFMSIYVPSVLQKRPGASFQLADSLIDLVDAYEAEHPEKFAVAHWVGELDRHKKRGIVSLPMGMENGSPLEGDLGNLEYFFDRGIRYITLTHALDNQICDSAYDTTRTWNGLSPFGFDVIREMNRLGIMVDISHVTDDTFFDVIETSVAPIIASHSSMRSFTPGWERNMSDEVLKSLAENGGVVMIAFGSAFLKSEYLEQGDALQEELQKYIDDNGLGEDAAFDYRNVQRRLNATGTIADLVDHIDHAVELVGVDHVGLGSDYDGVFLLPEGLQDVSTYPNLIAELLRRGYSESNIEKILGANLIRVWSEVENVARNWDTL